VAANTTIEWTEKTWNPVTGCTKVSQGCKNCYAERIAERFWGERAFTDVQCHPERLDQPLRWRKPCRVFVNSMSDLFHEAVPDEFIAQVLALAGDAPQHVYQVLTKRPERMRKILSEICAFGNCRPPANLWLGVSIENQKTADDRIAVLLETPAAVRWVSAEPLLGAVDLNNIRIGHVCLPGIDWVVCGGESGPGARPMHPDWARALRDQCLSAGVPFFFKQWGEWWPARPQYDDTDSAVRWHGLFEDPPNEGYWATHEVCLGNNGVKYTQIHGDDVYHDCQPHPGVNPWWMQRIGKKAAGRILDGREWDEFPVPKAEKL